MFPNKKRNHKNLFKLFCVCQFEGCNKEFFASYNKIYCKEHSKEKYKHQKYYNYKRKKDCIEDIQKENIYYKHDSFSSEVVIFRCVCCEKPFEVMILPRQYVYPKFCEEHRNEHKRKIFQKNVDLSLEN